jgi:hypothetical protein
MSRVCIIFQVVKASYQIGGCHQGWHGRMEPGSNDRATQRFEEFEEVGCCGDSRSYRTQTMRKN